MTLNCNDCSRKVRRYKQEDLYIFSWVQRIMIVKFERAGQLYSYSFNYVHEILNLRNENKTVRGLRAYSTPQLQA